MNAELIERTEEEYDEYLDELYPDCNIAGMSFSTSYALKELDPTAYRCGKNDYEDAYPQYGCSECGEIYDNEDDAEECCKNEEET